MLVDMPATAIALHLEAPSHNDGRRTVAEDGKEPE